MSRYIIQSDNQLERIKRLQARLSEMSNLDHPLLTTRPKTKKWSAVEVVQHMVLAHKVYAPKINKVLDSASKSEIDKTYRTSFIPSYLIKSFPPKDGKVKSKMKTFKRFVPVIENLQNVKVEDEINALRTCLDELSSWVEKYIHQDTAGIKFNSAIGAIVRFNVPEACEFILGHNERHFHQIEEAIRILKNKN